MMPLSLAAFLVLILPLSGCKQTEGPDSEGNSDPAG